jgi:hypothetical protein
LGHETAGGLGAEQREAISNDFAGLVKAMTLSDTLAVQTYWNGMDDMRRCRVLQYRDGLGESVLSCAVESDNIGAVRLFVEAGAEIDSPANHGATPLYTAAGKLWGYPIVCYLVEAGANKDFGYPERGHTVLMGALDSGDPASAEYLLEKGAAVSKEHKSDSGFTAAELAIRSDNVAVFRKLLEMGMYADADVVPPLEVAVLWNATSIVSACLSDPKLSVPAAGEGLARLIATAEKDDVRQMLLSFGTEQLVAGAAGSADVAPASPSKRSSGLSL